ncbi:MAG: hypothetical protein ACI89L_000696 [Phycisphaerales bacterium]|jgi:hypothetical protein
MLRSHTLAAIGVLAICNSFSLAAPPVQVMEYVIDFDLPTPGEIDSLGFGINDLGDEFRFVYLADPLGTPGIAFRSATGWQWIFEPQIQTSPDDVWTFDGNEQPYDGRLVIGRRYERVGDDEVTITENTPIESGYSAREIVTLAVDDWIAFKGNGGWHASALGQTVWQSNEPFVNAPIYLDDHGSVSEVDLSYLDDPFIDQILLHDLFDDGSLLIFVQGYELDSYERTGPKGWCCYESVHEFKTNDLGDWLGYIESDQVIWQPSGPSVTPPFSFVESHSTFVRVNFTNAMVTRDGEIAFGATLDNGTLGLFRGPDPDPDADALIADAESFFGRPLQLIASVLTLERERYLVGVYPGLADPTMVDWHVVTPCPADMNRDGYFDNGDIGEFITRYLDGSMRTDFNNDGVLDNGDIGEFITQFLKGC